MAMTQSPYDLRYAQIKNLLDAATPVYVHHFHCRDTVPSIVNTYGGESSPSGAVQGAGRIISVRAFKILTFVVVQQLDKKVQLIFNAESRSALSIKVFKRGDIVGFSGAVGRSKSGDLSIFLSELVMLAPCIRTLPTEHFGLRDPELIYRKRYVDLIINDSSRARFITRSRVISELRRFLDARDFVEVETPIMDLQYGGAAAQPFITHHNELKTDLYLRIAPELYHKKLIVGGLERVYEIGKVFRNEGIDLTHNPEFTSCELYMAYADMYSMMDIVQEYLVGLVKALYGGSTVSYKGHSVNFTAPFRQIDMLAQLSVDTKIPLSGDNIEGEDVRLQLLSHCRECGLEVDLPHSTARLLDKLVGHYIEPTCIDPTFIIHHPILMSPLAKAHRSIAGVTERFELFICGKEVANAYTELNDPFDQRRRFLKQLEEKKGGDGEAMMFDEGFVEALEYGLPPTGGLGIGIDRLVMYLTEASNIRDVLLFPTMKRE